MPINYRNISNPVYLVLPDEFDEPLKCRLVCPYSDDTYLFEYSKYNTRQTIVAHDKAIYFTEETARKAFEEARSAVNENVSKIPFEVYLVDPTRFSGPVKCKIAGSEQGNKSPKIFINMFYVTYQTDDKTEIAFVPGTTLFKNYEAAMKAYNHAKLGLNIIKIKRGAL